jgi:hypothetical protein
MIFFGKPLRTFPDRALGRDIKRGLAMNGAEQNKERDREIARNEEKRQAIGAIRVSGWAIVFTIIIAVIVVGLIWFVRR